VCNATVAIQPTVENWEFPELGKSLAPLVSSLKAAYLSRENPIYSDYLARSQRTMQL